MPADPTPAKENTACLALDLVARARSGTLVYVDPTGDRLEALAAAAAAFAPELEVLCIPAADVLPYDRAVPSGRVSGQRVSALVRMAMAPERPRLVVTSARALMARVPPPSCWREAELVLRPGDPVDGQALHASLLAWGYVDDEHVDEPGQAALRGQVLDVFPGDGAAPARLLVEAERITSIHGVDAASQRSTEDLPSLVVRPVTEIDPAAVRAGPAATEGLVGLPSFLPAAPILLHRGATERWPELWEEAEDAHAATRRARRVSDEAADGAYLPPPSRLFIPPAEMEALLAGRIVEEATGLGQAAPVSSGGRPATLARAIQAALAEGRVVLGTLDDALPAALQRRGVSLHRAATWEATMAAPAEQAVLVPIALDAGFARPGLTVLAVGAPVQVRTAGLPVEEPPRMGDIVVHEELGACRLRKLAVVEEEERVALEFAEGTELLVPAGDLDRIWRYGSEAGAIALDHLHGEGWRKRRDQIAAEVAATAKALSAEAAARAAMQAPVIQPPSAAMERFARRFPYPLSPDQEAAIDATLADLSSGRPMDRLVCGDVGFGKTEVALRAAAAAALAGFQVAVMAPTTVLARQHFDQFSRRFAGLGIEVAALLRGAGTAAGRAVRDRLADGSVGVVVGTQAVAAPGIRFKRLGLAVIDEEQRFGDADKKRLAALRAADGGVHSLVMTATPIPRTLQSALVGLRQISVIATPPRRRQPTRTFVLPFDPVVVREALLREHRRGGQSFVVCPRIEDLQPAAATIAELVPELSAVTAHGKLKPQALEQLVAEFAAGEHDVLLATNIIEAGLDIPRANTILIQRPDRFGLAQLHQMRGRVGRGDRRGVAYLLTQAGRAIPLRTERRLRTLEHATELGAGVAISLADMDARGAGDLFGDKQAGHVHAIGTELYQHLLGAELARAAGQPPKPEPAELHTGVAGHIPDELVAEPDLRLALYRQLARLDTEAAVDDFTEELADRFGDLPQPLQSLLAQARLRAWCVGAAVRRLDAGPDAVALTPLQPAAAEDLARRFGDAAVKGERVILPLAVGNPQERLDAISALVGSAAPTG